MTYNFSTTVSPGDPEVETVKSYHDEDGFEIVEFQFTDGTSTMMHGVQLRAMARWLSSP